MMTSSINTILTEIEKLGPFRYQKAIWIDYVIKWIFIHISYIFGNDLVYFNE